MVLGWRRAFCTSIPKDEERDSPIIREKLEPSPRVRSRFGGFFSEPSTPRLQSQPGSPTLRCRTTAVTPPPPPLSSESNKDPRSPKLQCKTKNSPRFFFNRSAPSSPRSPSTFSVLKSSLRLSKSRCGICLQSVKTGQGTAIFTAECGHSFHFPCITTHMKKQGSLMCPICNSTWKEMHLLSTGNSKQGQIRGGGGDTIFRDINSKVDKRSVLLKVYNDDEPLASPTSGARFNPIPESDETEEENDEFQGFIAASNVNVVTVETKVRNVEVSLLSEAAVVSVGRMTATYGVVLKIKAPAAPLRGAPIDLVTVLDVSSSVTADKLRLMRRVMRMLVSSLSDADRLSIVAFSTTSKRLLPLRRMTTAGRRSARRIIDAVVSLDGGGATSVTDTLKKAAKVIEDRRERNPTARIMLITDGCRSDVVVTSTRFSHLEIPVHSVSLSACLNAPPDDTVAKCITGLLDDVVQDFKIQLGFTSGSAPAEISAVYSYTGRPVFVGSGSNWCRVGDFHSGEERELLIELKVPSSLGGAQRHLTVRRSYKDPSTQHTICDKVEQPLLIPRPRAVGSSTRLRCLFVTARAVSESRSLAERNDVVGAQHILTSARALVLQSSSGSGSEFVHGLEAELAELNWKGNNSGVAARTDDKAEALTPTSAWRAAERLAKVAIMRKSLNRVGDLHGFENARF
ncbi:hypothetical protein OROGR_007971 [Orobanche gracilis]